MVLPGFHFPHQESNSFGIIKSINESNYDKITGFLHNEMSLGVSVQQGYKAFKQQLEQTKMPAQYN